MREISPWAAAVSVLAAMAGFVVAVRAGGAWLEAVLAEPWLKRRETSRFIDKLGVAVRQSIVDGAALAVAIAVGRGIIAALLPKSDLARTAAMSGLEYLTVIGLYRLAGRFVLSPQAPERRLMPLPHAERHFRLFVLYAVFGYAITPLAHVIDAASDNSAGILGLLIVFGFLVTCYKLWWFWTARHDISALVRTTGPNPAHPSLPRRAGAVLLPTLLIAIAIAILVVAHLSAFTPRAQDLAAVAGSTQLLAIFLPMLASGIDAFFRDLAARRHAEPARPIETALIMAVRTLCVSALWVCGIAFIVRGWAAFYVEMNRVEIVENARTFILVATVGVLGFGFWAFLRAIFDAYAHKHRHPILPSQDDDAAPPVESRLGTVMPLLRGLALSSVIAVTGLLALSYLGVNISPLLAGAGVIGLAISFGSQALVRDIVSGIFFMADDAFRVGEYIDTGRLKGTVENITLRSVQLRHQNGQVHTVPFGQLQAITNFSRDWATVKFNISIEHGTDLDKARKVIKSVGAQMLQDPDFAQEFLLPLKLQGVTDITPTALVLRLKFTAKPIRASWLQREAMKRVYNALRAADINFASNAVFVRGSAPSEMAAAAAMANTIRSSEREVAT